MKYVLRALAVVYGLVATLSVLIGSVGFAFSASQGPITALGTLAVLYLVAILLILGAREAWKDTHSPSLKRSIMIFLPGLVLGSYFILESFHYVSRL